MIITIIYNIINIIIIHIINSSSNIIGNIKIINSNILLLINILLNNMIVFSNIIMIINNHHNNNILSGPLRFRYFECSRPLYTPAVWHNVNPLLDHRLHFCCPHSSQRLLDHLQNSALVLELWGLQGGSGPGGGACRVGLDRGGEGPAGWGHKATCII